MAKDFWDEMRKMREEMDRMFRELNERFYSGERLLPVPGERIPALRSAVADLQETDEDVIATIELPGIMKEDIELNLTETMLEVKAEVKEEKREKEEGFESYRKRYSGFYRRMPLPTKVDPDAAKATYQNGILEVKMPKQEGKKRKEISIE